LLPLFKEWLTLLSAVEYLPKFLAAGYDLRFVQKHGLSDADLDCVGVPISKFGLRRRLMALDKLEQVYTPSDEDDEDEEEEDEESGDAEEEDDEEDD
jgi:hypothetical protein